MRLLMLALMLVSSSTLASWHLDNSKSQLNFISTKNEHISEIHTFDTLTGSLGNDGKLSVEIDLTSVNTLIPIRNTRMQEMLFNVAAHKLASFNTTLPATIMQLGVGEQVMLEQAGTMHISGADAEVTFSISVSRLDDNTFVAHTLKPTLLSANQFDLTGGIDALRSVAGLKSISYTVPVTFSVTFVATK
ncbi:YceI family protein [Alteromonas facilis]|uniref:YceI family protein n=1 Tax=Alteromonas facilis TaxID=2048004 RepID=UPI000C28FF5E|nr:YceI family protein [Alteromonas facilis]